MADMKKRYGSELRRLRNEAGLLLKDLIAVIGLSNLSYLAEVEKGQKAPFDYPRTKVLESVLKSRIGAKKFRSRLLLHSVEYKLADAFPDVSESTLERAAIEIAKEISDSG